MTLIEIIDRLTHIVATIDDGDGEIDEALEADLDAAEADLDRKVEACLRYATDLAALAAARKERAAALSARAASADGQARRLREYVRASLIKAGIKRMEAGDFACTIAAPSKSVALDDEAAFITWAEVERRDLLRFRLPEPARSEIARALKAGAMLPGARLVDGEPGLRVR